MKRTVLTILLAGCILLSAGCSGSPVGNGQGQATSDSVPVIEEIVFEELSANASGVYEIKTPGGLLFVAENPDKDYLLCADIDMNGFEWTPLGTDDRPFGGSFDGGGYSISDLKIKLSAENDAVGFFGVNAGSVKNLTLRSISCTGTADEAAIGGIAGKNLGSITDCAVGGALDAETTGKGSVCIGGIAGVNEGTIADTVSEFDLSLAAKTDDAFVGGIVGESTGGELRGCEAAGRLVIDGDGATVGLLGGMIDGTALTDCRFGGSMNTLGGKLFNTLVGSGEAEPIGCLWRDNANSDELLEQGAYELRQTCEETMREQGEISWSPDRTLTYFCSCGSTYHTQVFAAGETYTGLPYTHKQGDMSRFLYCFNEDGTLKDWVADFGYDGFDMYMGNDCSGAIYWAWSKVSDSIDFKWTYTMLPAYGCGTLPIGEYDAYCSTNNTSVIMNSSTPEVMYEAYAKMHLADAVVTYYDEENHVRMCAVNPVVFRDADGVIDPQESYVITHEQGDGLFDATNSSWRIDWRYSFAELAKNYYIPITVKELEDGAAPKASVTIDNDREGRAFLCAGVIESNYRIISTNAVLADKKGKTVAEKTIFTGIGKWESVSSDTILRTTVKRVDMAEFAEFVSTVPLESGETYTYSIDVSLSNGETVTVKSFDFVY